MRPSFACLKLLNCKLEAINYPRPRQTVTCCSDQAWAETGNACDIASRHRGAAGIISLFGLQQLPDAHLALANWVKALDPGALSHCLLCHSCSFMNPSSLMVQPQPELSCCCTCPMKLLISQLQTIFTLQILQQNASCCGFRHTLSSSRLGYLERSGVPPSSMVTTGLNGKDASRSLAQQFVCWSYRRCGSCDILASACRAGGSLAAPC